MTVLTQTPNVTGANLYGNDTVAQMPLGAYAETQDGRGFRYAKIGAVSTVPGKLYQNSAVDATNQTPSGGLSVNATSVGDKSFTISSSITVAANFWAGGYVSVNITPNAGYIYQIGGNTLSGGTQASPSAGTGVVVTLLDPIAVTAWTTSTKVDIIPPAFAGAVVYPTTATGIAVGVPGTIITNANFGWLQTYGPASVLTGTATSMASGVPASPSTAVAGALVVATAVLPTVAWCMATQIATEYNMYYLLIH